MSARGSAVIVAARRTAVAPRGGAFRQLQADELAAPVMRAVVADAGLAGTDVDQVIVGNALYGGGNPARLAALRAGLPETLPAMTLDTQCCSGLDAILHAAHLVEAGVAGIVLAGGAESYSRAPVRMTRPIAPGEISVPYDRPPFSPWADRDPDLTSAAADLASIRKMSREEQAGFAVDSHAKARVFITSDRRHQEFVQIEDAPLGQDAFTRTLTRRAALRAPVIAGDGTTGLSAATIAVEADAAALVLVMSEHEARRRGVARALRILGGCSVGGDPAQPSCVPMDAVERLLETTGTAAGQLSAIELMEAYAVQAMVNISDLALDPTRVNRNGGALSRGHPIGASGAILAVRLFHELAREQTGAIGLAAIAAAGGLATAMAVLSIAP